LNKETLIMMNKLFAVGFLLASVSAYAAPTSEEFKAQLLSHDWCGKSQSGEDVDVHFVVQDGAFAFQAQGGNNVQIDELALDGGTAKATYSATTFTYRDASSVVFVSTFVFKGESLVLTSCVAK
jgi:hypothetical protein